MAKTMRAMVLDAGAHRLQPADLPISEPGRGQVRLRVRACGVCRTDLHVVDGDLTEPKPRVVPGHEVVGIVDAVGAGVDASRIGGRVGVPWLGHTCGTCPYCAEARENLCDAPAFTGYTIDGGYAEYCVADTAYIFDLPARYDDLHAAPLLCAGLIGFRSWNMVRSVKRLGIFGFGAAAHIVAQVAAAKGQDVYGLHPPGRC